MPTSRAGRCSHPNAGHSMAADAFARFIYREVAHFSRLVEALFPAVPVLLGNRRDPLSDWFVYCAAATALPVDYMAFVFQVLMIGFFSGVTILGNVLGPDGREARNQP